MQSALDQAITDASTSEATYIADTGAVQGIQANIEAATTSAQTAIQAATAPLADAQAKVVNDAVDFNAKLDALAAAAQAAKVPIPGSGSTAPAA